MVVYTKCNLLINVEIYIFSLTVEDLSQLSNTEKDFAEKVSLFANFKFSTYLQILCKSSMLLGCDFEL